MPKNDFDLNNNDLPSLEEYIVSSDDLPSIEESIDSDLPSINDFITEEPVEEEIINEDLPSIQDFLVEDKEEEDLENICEEVITEEFITLEDLALMIEDVRNNIPDIPEIRYYEEPLLELNERINLLPEVKYYDTEIECLQEDLIQIRNSIPQIPEWINEEFHSSLVESISSFENGISFILDKLDVLKFENKVDTDTLERKVEEFNNFKNDTYENLETLSKDLINLQNSIKSSEEKILDSIPELPQLPEVKYYDDDIELVKKLISELSEKLLEIKIPKIPEVKYYDDDIKNLYNEIERLNEKIKLTENKKEYVEIREEIKEDPLTNTNFATLDDLKQHYTLFVNRIQKQLASIGGGGETRLEFLDDVDRNSAKTDGYYLKYNATTGKFIGAVAGSSQTLDQTLGFGNTSSLGISVGISTFNSESGIGTVYVGFGSTALYVDGDARITGILTVGRSSVTIDGDNNTITAGNILITGSSITIGDNVTINAGATGINSAPNIIYVAKDGNDSNNGTSIDNAKLTVGAAVTVAEEGTTIKVLSGTYNENNPIEVPPFVSIVGDNLKTVTIIPNNSVEDIFHVNKGTYLANMTFVGHTAPAAAVAFPPTIATNVGGGKWESPYVQNCTSNTTTGTGMRIDGDLAEGLKSMVVDSYTQYNQGGVGIAITNNGYAQLVSVFTICCNESISAYKGGQCSLTNSNTDFGTYGLIADGVSDLQFTGIITSQSTSGTNIVSLGLSTSIRPYEGQVVYFDRLYYTINTISITNGGSGYITAPTVSIASPTGPNGVTATAFATIENGSVNEITIINSGNQYTEAPIITISAPDSGVTATAEANINPIYYTINSSTPIISGITTVTLEENLNNTIGIGTTAYFYQVSRITASSHTFEYVGSGNDITTATPLRGGSSIQENEVVTTNGGRVVFTSTDQSGNFRIGNDIVINQNTGTVSGRAFTRSLFNQMTPFILALS